MVGGPDCEACHHPWGCIGATGCVTVGGTGWLMGPYHCWLGTANLAMYCSWPPVVVGMACPWGAVDETDDDWAGQLSSACGPVHRGANWVPWYSQLPSVWYRQPSYSLPHFLQSSLEQPSGDHMLEGLGFRHGHREGLRQVLPSDSWV